MKNYRLVYILIILISITLSSPEKINATSFWGSDLTWQCVGQDSFTFTLTLYRDCNGTWSYNAPLDIKCNSTGATITSLTIPVPSGVDITPVCNSSCTRCQSSSCSFPYGIQKFVYNSNIVNLSGAGSCCEIRVSSSMCCRSSSITTGPSGTLYNEAILNRCVTPCDNSPTFSNPPVNIICLGQDFVFNHGVTDFDSDPLGGSADSLTYLWTKPLNAASSPCTYSSPYSYNKSIWFWGFPYNNLPFPRGFHLDPNTGDIMFRPMKLENTVMAVEVKEFRGGVHIGTVRRDIGILIIDCPNNHPPVVSGPYYKEICVNDTVVFNISTNDYDLNDSVSISYNYSLTGAIWSDSNGLLQQSSGSLIWVPDSNSASSIPYTFTVTATDNACPVKGSTTRAYQILVKPLPRARIIITDSSCGNYWFFVQHIQGSGPSYVWQCNDANEYFYSSGPTASHKFNTIGEFPITMTMTAQQCSRTYFDTIIINDSFPRVKLPDDTILCKGSYLTIPAKFLNIKGQLNFKWSTGDTVNQQITIGPLINNTGIGISISDSTTCSDAASMFIDISVLNINLGQDKVICDVGDYALFTPNYYSDHQPVYFSWYKAGDSSKIDSQTNLTVYDTGVYVCKIINNIGCQDYDTIRVSKNQPPIITVGTVSGDTIFCENEGLIHLYANPYGGYWTGPAGTITANYFNTNVGQGTYKLIYNYSDGPSCMYRDSIFLSIKETPTVNISRNIKTQCEGDIFTLFSNFSNAQGILWMEGLESDGRYIGNLNEPIINYDPGTEDLSKLYFWIKIKAIDSANICNEVYDSLKITIRAKPEPEFTAFPLSGTAPLIVIFNNLSTIVNGSIVEHYWDFGDYTAAYLEEPAHNYMGPGNYTVKLRVKSDLDCSNELIKTDYITAWSVGIVEFSPNKMLEIHPNPVNDKTTLVLKNQNLSIVSARLINSIGEVVREYPGINKKEFVINRADLNNGIYIIDIKLNTNTRVFQRIVFY